MKRIMIFAAVAFFTLSANAQRGYVERKIEDKYEDKYGKPGMEKYNDWMNGKVLNAKVEPEYNFPLSLTMEVTDYKKGKKKDPTEVTYYVNATNSNFATINQDSKKKDEMLMIYDVKSNVMLMLDMKKKSGMAININGFMSGKMIAEREKNMAEGGSGKDTKHDCKKTGKTKTIQGYSCNEYICTDAERDTRSEIWISDKIPVNISRANTRGPMSGYFAGMGGMNGMMMEGNFYKHDELESTMLVTNVNTSANLKIKSAEYEINGH
jgi:hypothetical protein